MNFKIKNNLDKVYNFLDISNVNSNSNQIECISCNKFYNLNNLK